MAGGAARLEPIRVVSGLPPRLQRLRRRQRLCTLVATNFCEIGRLFRGG